MSFVPHRFLVRVAHPCRFVQDMPDAEGDDLLDLPESCRIDNYAALEGKANFADVRMAWNDLGLAVQVTVAGKDQAPVGDPARPRYSDGVTIWLDTRGDRSGHRATRFCHQFHLLPSGGGADRDEPLLLQTKINRALQDAPLCNPAEVHFRAGHRKGGYRVEAFFPAAALNGFDPEEHPQLGFYYAVRDQELGEQVLSVGSEFPYADDPSLWGVLDLVK
jgi:Carbohydrate family 9 binding domain-like